MSGFKRTRVLIVCLSALLLCSCSLDDTERQQQLNAVREEQSSIEGSSSIICAISTAYDLAYLINIFDDASFERAKLVKTGNTVKVKYGLTADKFFSALPMHDTEAKVIRVLYNPEQKTGTFDLIVHVKLKDVSIDAWVDTCYNVTVRDDTITSVEVAYVT